MNRNAEPSPSAVQASREVRAVISRLRRRILKASEVEDLTLVESTVLARLAGRDGVTASELAAQEGVRHQSMTATVASLAALDLVERRPDPDDGRRLLITLTAEGERQVEQGKRIRTEWLAARIQERCTEEERRAVVTTMAVLERLIVD